MRIINIDVVVGIGIDIDIDIDIGIGIDSLSWRRKSLHPCVRICFVLLNPN